MPHLCNFVLCIVAVSKWAHISKCYNDNKQFAKSNASFRITSKMFVSIYIFRRDFMRLKMFGFFGGWLPFPFEFCVHGDGLHATSRSMCSSFQFLFFSSIKNSLHSPLPHHHCWHTHIGWDSSFINLMPFVGHYF